MLTCGLQERPLEDCIGSLETLKRVTLWPRINFIILLAYVVSTRDLCWCLHIFRIDAQVHVTCVCAGSTRCLSCLRLFTARLRSRTSSAMVSCSLRKYTASPLGGTHSLGFPYLKHYYSTLHHHYDVWRTLNCHHSDYVILMYLF